MSFAATAWAFEQHRITPEQKLVLIILSDFHTPESGCQVSERVLAFETGLPLARLRDVLVELQRLKLATPRVTGGFELGFSEGGV